MLDYVFNHALILFPMIDAHERSRGNRLTAEKLSSENPEGNKDFGRDSRNWAIYLDLALIFFLFLFSLRIRFFFHLSLIAISRILLVKSVIVVLMELMVQHDSDK